MEIKYKVEIQIFTSCDFDFNNKTNNHFYKGFDEEFISKNSTLKEIEDTDFLINLFKEINNKVANSVDSKMHKIDNSNPITFDNYLKIIGGNCDKSKVIKELKYCDFFSNTCNREYQDITLKISKII